ncbi:hypothetical protein MLD38_002093 [Melastoma candidum]|uniref:Uncharacterized protein n=1 Tax=Melastoma candidum TaxID=119954 RepID=A0ACB9SEQ2_9MYRT|nr:hypothetical protein MLD38_002093 [Melastoma candidum]
MIGKVRRVGVLQSLAKQMMFIIERHCRRQSFLRALRWRIWNHHSNKFIHPVSLASIGLQSAVDTADNSFSAKATIGDVHSESVADSESHEGASVTLSGSLKKLLLTDDIKSPQESSLDKQSLVRNGSNNEHSLVPDGRSAEMLEGKKNSEKKSKKQKSSKSGIASDHVKANITASLEGSKQLESEALCLSDTAVEVGKGGKVPGTSDLSNIVAPESQHVESKPGFGGSVDMKDDPPKEMSSAVSTIEHVWKTAPGFKVNSLLEIQQEEQKKVHTERMVSEVPVAVNSQGSMNPRVGVVATPGKAEIKSVRDDLDGQRKIEFKLGKPPIHGGLQNKSQLHDVLAEDISVKSGQREVLDMDLKPSMSSSQVNLGLDQVQVVEEDNFIDAKEAKRNRKKSAKSRAGSRLPVAISPVDAPVISSSSLEKVKRSTVQDAEILPAVSSGPSLGDFVPWKVEPTISQTTAAWSIDSVKAIKPASLRDILKEQEKRLPFSTTIKSLSLKSPRQHSRPMLVHVKTGETGRFSSATKPGKGAKSIPMKASPGGSLSQQKPVEAKPDELFLSSPPSSVPSKAKMGTASKHSEAAFFRDWCESESVRLVGSKDTSFLEYCLTQSRSEAEMLLVENLESFDKFLNYKELLPSDVIEIAFRARNGQKATALGSREMNSNETGLGRKPSTGVARGHGRATIQRGRRRRREEEEGEEG